MQPLTSQVLLKEHSAELCQLVSQYLLQGGLAVEIVQHGSRGAKCTISGDYATVTLDITLSDVQGIEVLRRAHTASRTPVPMLTAQDKEQYKIIGLEMGADDCLPKSFDPKELLAQVEAILRRSMLDLAETKQKTPRYIVVEDIKLDNTARSAQLNGKRLELTTVEYDLLKALLISAGQVLSRKDLVQMVLDRDFSPLDRSIDTHVSHLRRKLGPRPDGLERIKCVRSVGYLYVLSSSSQGDDM